jgi:hypothetical protein
VGAAAAAVGATVGATVPIGVVVGAAVPIGVAVATVGVCVALAGVAVVERVPEQGVLGRFTVNSHGGSADTGGALHVDLVMVSLINVTRSSRARTLPSTVAFAATVIVVSAKIVPLNDAFVPMLAESTFQKTLQA